MTEPGEATPADEALAYRLVLMGLHVDDEMGYAAMEEVLAGVDERSPGGKQRIANVMQVLAGHALNLAADRVGHQRAIDYYTGLLGEKTLEAMKDKEN